MCLLFLNFVLSSHLLLNNNLCFHPQKQIDCNSAIIVAVMASMLHLRSLLPFEKNKKREFMLEKKFISENSF